MIFPARMNRAKRHHGAGQAAGFTLLEVVFVLGMIAMLAVWLTVNVTTVDTEKRLREASGAVETMAKRARSVAMMQQRPYQVTISLDGVSMAPQFARSGSFSQGEDGEEAVAVFEDVLDSEPLDPEVKYEIRRWRSDLWDEIEGEDKLVLTIDPLGLVEPISIRCSLGNSWIMQELNPLTAGVNDEELSVEDD